jgi:glycosyltransferase involved in cell wall biosynthesis
VETIIADLCRYLPDHGWEVLLGLGRGKRFNDVGRYREAYPDLPVLAIDGCKGTRQGRREAVRQTLRQVRPDVVLVARLFDVYHVAATLKRRQGWPRLAVTIDAYEPHCLFDARLYREHIDLCRTSGHILRDAAVGWSELPAERVVSIPGGVWPPDVDVAPRAPGSALRLGYVGRIDAGQKRIFDLVALVGMLDAAGAKYTLEVVGSGDAEGDLRRQLADRVEAGRVSFLGWQPRAILYGEVLPRLDALVHFAFTEGVTIAPREAMVHGVVPVVSEFIGLRREGHFVHEVNALTFPVGDIVAAARCVRRLSEEPGLLERLSANAMHSQSGEYAFDGAIAAWARELDRCLALPPRTGRIPQLQFPPDGQLARWGVPAWVAQRVRDLLSRRHDHTNPGSEWPTGSGLVTREASESIRRYADSIERDAGPTLPRR